MTAEETVYAHLSEFAAFTATGATLHPLQVPPAQTPLPWVSYGLTAIEPVDPTVDAPAGSHHYEMGFAVSAETVAATRQIADAIRAALDGFSGGQILFSEHTHTEFLADAETDFYGASVEFGMIGKEAAVLTVQSNLPLVEVREDGLYFGGRRLAFADEIGPIGRAFRSAFSSAFR